MTTIKPILRYPGAKWQMSEWIVSNLPPHVHYVEPFFGSGAVFFNKPPAKHEVINDLSGDVVNLFRVIRERGAELAALIEMTPWAREEYEASYVPCEDTLERARQFVVRCWQAFGTLTSVRTGWRHQGVVDRRSQFMAQWRRLPEQLLLVADRLKGTEIERRPALRIVREYASPDVLIYADPPYVTETRRPRIYQHEMTDADHAALLDALDAHPGPVVLSGYACDLYDTRLSHWHRLTKQVQAEKGNTRTEVLWLNEAACPQTLFDL